MNLLFLLFLRFCFGAEVNLSKKYIYMKYENEICLKKKNYFYKKYINHVLENMSNIKDFIEIIDDENFKILIENDEQYQSYINLTTEILNVKNIKFFNCLHDEIELKNKLLNKYAPKNKNISCQNYNDVIIFLKNVTKFLQKETLAYLKKLEDRENYIRIHKFINKDVEKNKNYNSTFLKIYNLNKTKFLSKITKKTELNICEITNLNILQNFILETIKKENFDNPTKSVIILNINVYAFFFNLFVNFDDVNFILTPRLFNESLDNITELIKTNIESKEFEISEFKLFLAIMNIELYFDITNDAKTLNILKFQIDTFFKNKKKHLKSIVEVNDELNKNIIKYCSNIGQILNIEKLQSDAISLNEFFSNFASDQKNIQENASQETISSQSNYVNLDTEDQKSKTHFNTKEHQELNYASPNDEPSTSTKCFPCNSTSKRKYKSDTEQSKIFSFSIKKVKNK